MLRRIILAISFVAAVAIPSFAAKTVPQNAAEITLSFAPLVRQTTPAVVNVYAKTIVQGREQGMFADPFFRKFFGEGTNRQRDRVQNSLGSGVIVSGNGLIVTNNHVVKGASDIRIVLSDKREFEAKILVTDERTDLAVLKIDSEDEDLPALRFGNSDDIEVGDLVLAIGNPFGVGQTVTSGIVSALARNQVGISDYQFFIQTDAAINPGNSGGALVNMRGELVGINTAIYSRSGGSIGLGFSIPANMVQTVVQSAETGQKIKRPWLGATLQDVTQDIADSLGFARPEGALVAELDSQSPLRAAGLRSGDVIIAIDGRSVENAKELNYRVATARLGQFSIIEYRRRGVDREAQIKLVAAPESIKRETTRIEGKTPLSGMVVANLSPAVADEIGLATDAKGVVVFAIERAPALRFFKKGDILIAVNDEPVANTEELRTVLGEADGRWAVTIQRGNRKITLSMYQ
jgi:Do/DeqQ family serine protease